MKSIIYLFIASLFFYSCSSDDESGGDGSGGELDPQATYRITFSANFSSDTHPENYPENAMFSKMIVLLHNDNTTLFSENSIASEGLSAYAKEGATDLLSTELSSTDVNPTIVIIGNDIGPDAQDTVTVTITPSTTFLSFASKISPSPDWFVGVDSFSLLNEDNSLVESIELDLFAHDAGVDAGLDYISDDIEESIPVVEINTSPFVFTDGNILFKPRLGTLKIERLD